MPQWTLKKMAPDEYREPSSNSLTLIFGFTTLQIPF
jgi:hypothetical protein